MPCSGPCFPSGNLYDPHELGRVAVWRGPALQRKIVPDKAQGAGRSHSAVKSCNAGWRDFGPQPFGPGPFCRNTALQHAHGARYTTRTAPCLATKWPLARRRAKRQHALGPVDVSYDAALQPKIASGKAQSADRSHSAVKLCNAAWRDFGSQPAGTAAIFPQSGVAAGLCRTATPHSLRLVLRKNSRRRGAV